MAFEKSYDVDEQVTAPPCIHLRSKAMYVRGDVAVDDPEARGDHYCWCNLTQHVIGPDNANVNRCDCISDRSCFRATY